MRRYGDPQRQALADLQALFVRVDAAQPNFSLSAARPLLPVAG